MAIKGARAEDGRITPHLMVRGGKHAVAFYMLDPFGHLWALGTVKEELTPEQVHERMVASHG